MAQELGLAAEHKRFVAMYINGARRGALMEDTQVPNTEVIASVFPDDSEGDLHNTVWYEFGSVNSPQALPYTGISEAPEQLHHRRQKARALSLELAAPARFTEREMTSNLFLLVDAANTPAGSTFVNALDAL